MTQGRRTRKADEESERGKAQADSASLRRVLARLLLPASMICAVPGCGDAADNTITIPSNQKGNGGSGGSAQDGSVKDSDEEDTSDQDSMDLDASKEDGAGGASQDGSGMDSDQEDASDLDSSDDGDGGHAGEDLDSGVLDAHDDSADSSLEDGGDAYDAEVPDAEMDAGADAEQSDAMGMDGEALDSAQDSDLDDSSVPDSDVEDSSDMDVHDSADEGSVEVDSSVDSADDALDDAPEWDAQDGQGLEDSNLDGQSDQDAGDAKDDAGYSSYCDGVSAGSVSNTRLTRGQSREQGGYGFIYEDEQYTDNGVHLSVFCLSDGLNLGPMYFVHDGTDLVYERPVPAENVEVRVHLDYATYSFATVDITITDY